MLRKKYLAGLILTATVPCLSACGDGEGAANRQLLPAETKVPGLSAEAQRVRDMQQVRWTRHDSTTDKDTPMDWAPSTLGEHDVLRYCAGYQDPGWASLSDCQKAVTIKRGELCVAEFLLNAAKPRANALVLNEPFLRGSATEPNYISILPQSHATNVALLRGALDFANRALTLNMASYNGATMTVYTSCNATDGLNKTFPKSNPAQTLGSVLQESLVRAYEVGHEAAHLAVENILAVADAERSSSSSNVTASRRSWVQPGFSRVTAAQTLVGGSNPDGYLTDPSLTEPADFPVGFCPGKPLSAQAQRAADLLRSAAPPASWILDPSVTTEQMLDHYDDANLYGGSVAARLGDIMGNAELASTDDLPSELGLVLQDFDEAREYLKGEIKAFARDPAESSTPVAGHFYRPFTALNVTTEEAPDAFYVAVAAGQGDDGAWMLGSRNTANMSLSTFRELARGTATGFLQNAANRGLTTDEIQSFKQTGVQLEQQIINEVPGRISQTWNNTTGGTLNIYLGMYKDPGNVRYRIIRSETGLRCATKGSVEGRDCVRSEIENLVVADMSVIVPGPSIQPAVCTKTVKCYAANPTNLGTFLATKPRIYIVSTADDPATTTVLEGGEPGSYTLVGAMELRGPKDSYTEMPVASADYAEAAAILRPSKQWCNQPRLSCSKGSFDERLPLEDELANDGDGVESSWKHYLALAKEATQASDELGSAFVESALRVDQNEFSESIRLEQQRQALNAAFERLQDTCGTATDPQKLIDIVVGKPGRACASNAECSSSQSCVSGKCAAAARACSNDSDCPTSGTCTNNICSPDLSRLPAIAESTKDPDLQRLADCLRGGVYEFVAIGDTPLCVTRNAGETAYCPGIPDPTNPCPRPASVDSSEPPKALCAATGEVTVDFKQNTDGNTDVLSLFHAKKNTDKPYEVCDAIATLRDKGFASSKEGEKLYRETIRNSSVYLPQFVKDLASRIVFEARLGSFAAVKLGDLPIYFTGRMAGGQSVPNTGNWPCVPTGTTGVTPDPDHSLKWQHVNCSDVDQRSRMNDRLMRAVMLARFTGGSPNGKGMFVPGYAQDVDPKATASNTSIYYSPGGGAGNVSQADMNVDTFGAGTISARVYFTTDSSASGMTAYTTVWGGALTPIKVQQTASGHTNYAAFGNFTDQSNGPWINVMEVADAKKAGIYVGPDADPYPDPFATPDLFGLSEAFTEKGELLETWEGPNRKTWARSFPLNTPEQWYDGLSTAVEPSADGEYPAFSWFSGALASLAFGSPIEELPGFIHAVGVVKHGISYHDPVKFSTSSMLDALELLCMARAVESSGLKPDLNNPPTATSPNELPMIKAYLNEMAARIEDWASRFVLPNFPKAAADFAREQTRSGVVPGLGGSYATTLTTLRASLVEFAQVAPLMAFELRQLGVAVDQARIATSKTDLQKELNLLNFESTLASGAAACAGAAASTDAKLSFGASAGVACANAVVQGIIAAKQMSIGNELADLDKSGAMNSFQEQLNTHAQALQSYASRISKSLEELDGSIAELERQRLGAERALVEAIRIASFMPANVASINATLVNQRETAKERYVRAFENAKRMSFLAKRAIEQRLGVPFASMTDDLPLVEAPNTWEATLCDRSGVNWEQISSGNSDVPQNYADAYIGEYVSKLERVVESYRLEHSFHEGSDTAVISMRDDVFNYKAPCPTLTKNLLEHSNDLGAAGDADGRHGWAPTGCTLRTDPTSGDKLAPQNCVAVKPADGVAVKGVESDTGGIAPFKLFAGKATHEACTTGECDYVPPSSGVAGSAWAQKIYLSAGIYRLSYFTAPCVPHNCPDTRVTARATVPTTGDLGLTFYPGRYLEGTIDGVDGDWQQSFAIMRLTQGTDVSIEFRPFITSTTGVSGLLASPMLEEIAATTTTADSDLIPDSIVTNNAGRMISLDSCEDTNGDVFRTTGWRRGEAPLCPDGFNGHCDSTKSQKYGYREIPFSINQRDIESGSILKKAGFALGNFNYRIESIALNFVGTGIRNCSQSDAPSTCYSGAYVPYSLDHVGPYLVRNHMGGTFEAKLFTGHIENARGLAAERYITNPLSSSDGQLLSDYVRTELQGRPLDGNFIIRLWDAQGVDFNAIDDIQVVLKYRYWTRFD